MRVDRYPPMYLDNDGSVMITGSPSIHEQSPAISTDEVRQTFLNTVEPKPTVDLRIGDTPKVLAFYKRALDNILQFDCCIIIVAFIKFIEPNKQARYPYTGKLKKRSARAISGDPESTRPPWWPVGIMHKRPVYLGKQGQTELLLHIICKLTPFKINADKLMDVVRITKNLKGELSAETICEMLRVRRMEESFENGEVNEQEVIRVRNRERKVQSDEEEDFNEFSTYISSVEGSSRHHSEQILMKLHSIDHKNSQILLQEYIKMIEPMKRVTYPYEKRKCLTSKPPWWLPTIRHVRPRYLTEYERIMLLTHILCDVDVSYRVTTHRLREANAIIRARVCESARPLLNELYRVREEEESLLINFNGNRPLLQFRLMH